MKVLHLTSTFPRTAGGPGGSFLEDLARAEAAAGMEVTVLAPHDAGLADREEWGAVSLRRFRYGPERWETLSYRGGLMGTARGLRGLVMVPVFIWAVYNAATAAARDKRPDIIHAHWWLPAGLAAVFAARSLGVPLVITCHGSDVALAQRRRFLVRPLARWVFRRATTVATVSEALKAEVRALAGVDATVLRMPVALPTPTTSGSEWRSPPPSPRSWQEVVAAGRLSPEKGFDVLIEALAAAAGVNAEIIGDGPELERLRDCATRLNLADRVTFSPALPRVDYLTKLAKADAVVVPSRHEGLGLAAVEALALGRPVIATSAGGLPEVVAAAAAAGSARLVPPGDVDALAAALGRLPFPNPTPEIANQAAAPHRPVAVATAHADAYRAAAAAVTEAPPAKRRRPLRWLGAAAGLFLLLALVTAVTDDLSDLRDAVRNPHLGWLAAAAALALGAELAFALASAVVGRTLVRPEPPIGRTAATYLVAQQAKHVPGGIWPAVARAGLSRRLHPGLGPRLAFLWVLGESLASVAAGLVTGGGLMLTSTGDLRPRAWGAVALAAGLMALLLFGVSRRTLLAGLLDLAGRPVPSLTRLATAHLPAWLGTGVASAALAAALIDPGLGRAALLTIAAAAIVASVAGFLALPVPAGLGVREAVFVALAAGVLTGPQAIVVALAARLLSLAAQVALAAAAWPMINRTRNEPMIKGRSNGTSITGVDRKWRDGPG